MIPASRVLLKSSEAPTRLLLPRAVHEPALLASAAVIAPGVSPARVSAPPAAAGSIPAAAAAVAPRRRRARVAAAARARRTLPPRLCREVSSGVPTRVTNAIFGRVTTTVNNTNTTGRRRQHVHGRASSRVQRARVGAETHQKRDGVRREARPAARRAVHPGAPLVVVRPRVDVRARGEEVGQDVEGSVRGGDHQRRAAFASKRAGRVIRVIIIRFARTVRRRLGREPVAAQVDRDAAALGW